MISTLVIAYVSVRHVLVPTTVRMMAMLRTSTSGRGMVRGEDILLRVDASLQLPPLHEERARIHLINKARKSLEVLERASRMKVFERIVPEWFHRNDPAVLKTAVDAKMERKDPLPDNAKGDGSKAGESISERDTDERKKNVESADSKAGNRKLEDFSAVSVSAQIQPLPLRQLSNLHMFVNVSHCPPASAVKDISITLVIQSSLDRVWVLEETCHRWTDPIIMVVGVSVDESHHELSAALSGWKDRCPQLTLLEHRLDEEQAKPERYPLNALRNMALDHVETSHALVLDVDFVPSDNLQDTIRNALMERRDWRAKVGGNGLDALVVPAFERVLFPPCSSNDDCRKYLRHNSSFIPHNFQQLSACIQQNECIVFQSNINLEGHLSTRSIDWLAEKWYTDTNNTTTNNSTHSRALKSVDCFNSLRYEPYVVIPWCQSRPGESRTVPASPYYDERFHGYGKNKIQHVQHLRVMGFQFPVLPEGFIVHNPHEESEAKKIWNDVDTSDLHASMDLLYPKFLRELTALYKNRSQAMVQPCSKTG